MTTENNLVLSGDNPSMPEGFFDEKKLFEDGEGDPTNQGNNVDSTKTNETIPDEVITISRKDLQKEIDRLRLEDPDFAQVYNRDIGNKAKQRYQPEIDGLKATNEALSIAVRKGAYEKLTPEEVNEKFKTDPKFAVDYADVSHREVTIPREPTIEDIGRVAAPMVSNVLSMAEQLLPLDKLESLRKDIEAGKYDIDETGTPYGVYNWREGIDRLQRIVVGMARIPVVETKPVITASKVDTSKPDMTNGGGSGGSTGKDKFTMAQVRQMPWEEQFRRWPNEGDLDRAVANGEITLPT